MEIFAGTKWGSPPYWRMTPCVQRTLWEKERGLSETSKRTFNKILIHWSIACEIQNMHGIG